jgi:aminoglycoside phosphotransferase (APT) family kinase protein
MALPTTRMSLPLTLDEVTPTWLTQALSTRFPGVDVVMAVRDSERAGTSTSARFSLAYRAGTAVPDAPATVYVKGGFDAVMRRRVWAALIQEARFFGELSADVPINVPVAYFAGIDEEARQGVLILEDMTTRNVHFGHATDHVSIATAAALVTDLARLHARFWDDPRLAGYRDWAEPQRAYLRYLCRQKHWDEVLERPNADLLVQVLPTPEAALDALERMWALNDARVPTLVHGDCHGGNLFFEADGSPGFLDWQCTFPGTGAHDLGELLLTTLDTDDRRRSERDLIGAYQQALVANGVANAPTAEDVFLSYRQNVMHNMVSSVLNPYDMQTAEVTTITAGRTLHAAIDLHLLDALDL